MLIPPDEFLRGGIREICDDTGALMIVDEVQTGMGRTGKWFAFQHSGVTPDIVTTAKGGLASGFPIGALVAREELEFKKGEHGEYVCRRPARLRGGARDDRRHRGDPPDVTRKGERFMKGLARHNPPGGPRPDRRHIGRRPVPGGAADLRRERGGACQLRCDGNLRLIPPLVITDEEIDAAVGVIDAALD